MEISVLSSTVTDISCPARQLMVVDSKARLVTARAQPHMVLISVSVSGGQLTLNYPGGLPPVSVRLPGPRQPPGPARPGYAVFSEAVAGWDLGEEVSAWLSEVILSEPEAGLRLVYHPATLSSRPDKVRDEVSPNMKAEDKPYYADTFAYMMLSQPSIAGLNQLLSQEDVDLEVEHTRFRPNIFIEGDFPAFSEDKWAFIKIGEVVMRNVRVCDRFVTTQNTDQSWRSDCFRCVFTTVDPELGDKHPQQEPLKTLRSGGGGRGCCPTLYFYKTFQKVPVRPGAKRKTYLGLLTIVRGLPGGGNPPG